MKKKIGVSYFVFFAACPLFSMDKVITIDYSKITEDAARMCSKLDQLFMPIDLGPLLHEAIFFQNVACVDALIARDADVNARFIYCDSDPSHPDNNFTPLHMAVNQRKSSKNQPEKNFKIIRMLLAAGADPSLTIKILFKDSFHPSVFTPAAWARHQKHEEYATLIETWKPPSESTISESMTEEGRDIARMLTKRTLRHEFNERQRESLAFLNFKILHLDSQK